MMWLHMAHWADHSQARCQKLFLHAAAKWEMRIHWLHFPFSGVTVN